VMLSKSVLVSAASKLKARTSLRSPFSSLNVSNKHSYNSNGKANSTKWQSRTGLAVAIGSAIVLGSGIVFADDALHPPELPWPHYGIMTSFDTASLRRGFEVYRQVCSTCHSLDLVCYRHLVGVTHTEAQAKALAASVKIEDGPNMEGEMFQRPGRLTDKMKRPYKNDEYARFVNGGALPPDLSLMIKARHNGPDYVYSLLTGYRDSPAGIELRQGLHYNPYFPGGAISMAKALHDGLVEYEDGTPATISQMAKDVTSFLCWAAEPEYDERKRLGLRLITFAITAGALSMYYKRFRWSIYKTRRISYLK